MKKNKKIRNILLAVVVIALFLFNLSTNVISEKDVRIESDVITTDFSRIVSAYTDSNGNKISDILEENLSNLLVAKDLARSSMVDVIVSLNHMPDENDVRAIESYGGRVFQQWSHVIYSIHAEIPFENLYEYAEADSVVLIEKNSKIKTCLDFSVSQIRARPIVWDTYGYTGDSNQAVAILDTGIDDSHPDLSGKIVKWKDFSDDGYSNPVDYHDHGTHCAGVVAGTGSSSGSNTKKFTTDFSDYSWFCYDIGVFGHQTYVTTTASGTLTVKLNWDDDWGDGDGHAYIWIDKDQDEIRDEGEYSYDSPPFTYSASVNAGRYLISVAAYDNEAWLEDFYCQITVPTESIGDGHNLLRGVAPNVKLAGLKILNNDGSGNVDQIIDAIDWLAQYADDYGIIVASMSIGLNEGEINSNLDTAVNNLVSSGIVCVAAAGNYQGSYYVASPGSADKVLSVGAVNDEDELTEYSSIGNPSGNPVKPDVLAPGGSFQTGDGIISVDSNDADYTWMVKPDKYSNDYRQMCGTSMSCPTVAGIAALVADALGDWEYTQEQALQVKQLILMTSYEIGSAETGGFTPPFNHGEKDNKEGYGRVCADAAIEAASMEFDVDDNTFSFGTEVYNKKVWARQVQLLEDKEYTFSLDVPVTGNYDLYLYDEDPDENGEPILLDSSYNTGSTDESIQYIPDNNGTYYLVSKWRSGEGVAELTVSRSIPCTFSYSPDNPTTQDEISFTDTSNDIDIISWSWDFDDGTTSTDQNPSHQFGDDGVYNVNLTIVGKYGNTNSTITQINVANILPSADFSYSPLTPSTSDTVEFTDESSDIDGSITSWSWDFGDGNTSTSQNPTHQYSDDGIYTTILNVTDDDGSTNETSQQITVSNVGPTADFSYSPLTPSTSDTVEFTDESSDNDGSIASWSWDFGDGDTSTSQNPTHQYSDDGIYTVELTVTDDDGSSDTNSQQIILSNVGPTADFTYSPLYPSTNDTVTFTDSSSDSDGSIASWSWDFGDGNTSTNQNATNIYTLNGTYTVTLTVTDDDGASNSTSKNISVIFSGYMFVDDDANSEWYDTFHVRTIQESITNSSFGDIIYVYNGTYNENVDINKTVSLIGEDINSVIIDGGGSGNVLNISADWTNITGFSVINGSTGIRVSGNYTNISNNNVSNNGYGIEVRPYTPEGWCDFNCTYNNTIFKNLISYNSNDGIKFRSSYNNSITKNEIYNNSKGILFSRSGSNTVFYNNITNNSDIGISIDCTGFIPECGCFYNCKNNLIYNNNFLNNTIGHAWDPQGQHNYWNNCYLTGGNYWDNYTGLDLYHGSNQNILGPDGIGDIPYDYILDGSGQDNYPYIQKSGWIYYIPTSNFSYSPANPYTSDIIVFSDESNDTDGIIVNWTWDFGDETTLNYSQNTTHNYSDDGTYTVNLTVKDDSGYCNTTSKQISVSNVAPTSNFTHQPNNPTVEDIVQFTDTSTDYDGTVVNWTWDFGDGTLSYSQNPTHQYNSNLTYNVTLTVKDDDGDSSYSTKQIITKIIYNMSLDDNETTIDLQNEIGVVLTINSTTSNAINITKFSGNPTNENISGNITSIGKYIKLDIENESNIRWPIDIKIYYTQDDLNSSGLNETQLLGIYFWNDTTDEWTIYNDTGVNSSYNQSGFEGYFWANAWHLTNITSGGDCEPPSKVTGLTVTDAKDGKLNLAWTDATDNVAVNHYKIYRDNVFLINRTTNSYQDTGLTNGHSYAYNISAIDNSGNEGEKSDAVSGTPTSSPSTGGNPPGGGGGLPPAIGSSNDPPVANLSAGKPYVGFVGSPVTFDGSLSSDLDGNITKWFWNFGDGANGLGEIVTHVYSTAGIYTAILTVTDNDNATDSDITTVVINVQNIPPINPIIDGPTVGNKNVNYSYSVLSTDANNDTIKYTFDWGDGTIELSSFLPNGTSWVRNHSWSAAGKYIIKVTANDNQTNSSSEKTIWIDAISVQNIGYLLDIDSDGKYDLFYNEVNGKETSLGHKGGFYLIDSDGDGKWDYTFDLAEGLISYKEEKETPGFEIIFMLIAVVLVLFWHRKRI